MNVEWSIPFTLTSPYGTLDFNGSGSTPGYRYLLDPKKCRVGTQTLRTTSDDNPQADGGIVHRAFRSLTTMKLGVEFWYGAGPADVAPACGAHLVEMYDLLMLHLGGLISPSQAALDGGSARIEWAPTGQSDDRLLDRIQMLLWSDPQNDGALVTDEFTFQSPYPYAISKTQTTTTLSGLTSLVNAGTTPFYPVYKVHGPATTFQIFNATTQLNFSYDGTLPGAISIPGGSYAEIVTFTNTMYLNGDQTNLKPGLVVPDSDFFPLIPGDNELSRLGDGTVDVLWNHAYG